MNMTMVNWKTTVTGIVTAIFGFILFSPDLFSGAPWLVQIAKYGAAGGLLSFGIFAKDANVTGGTTPQPSNEAAKASMLDPTSTKEGVQK